MAAAEDTEDFDVPRKRSVLPMILGCSFAVLLGTGGFFTAYSGLLQDSDGKPAKVEQALEPLALGDVAFVPIEPMLVTLGSGESLRHLRFEAQIEVRPGSEPEVIRLMPRILDVLNTYLRAVDPSDLEKPTSLLRLRSQMLRRIQIIVDRERIRDLLITEFVISGG